jgi:hypothetical protein
MAALKTWGDVYWHHVRKGRDRSDAAFRADEWERRQQRKCRLCGAEQ